MPPVPRQPEFLTVARIVRVRGLKGEVAAEILTDFPSRLTRLKEVFLSPAPGAAEPRRVAVRRCWLSPAHGGQAIFHFAGCDSAEDAGQLAGLEVQIPYSQRAPLEPGQYYFGELIGCAVWERKEAGGVKKEEEVKDKDPGVKSAAKPSFATSSTPSAPLASFAILGAVRDVWTDTGTPLLVVDTPAGELLIPLAADICRVIDPVARRIEVVLPAGLRELNQSS